MRYSEPNAINAMQIEVKECRYVNKAKEETGRVVV
jgi:hypothetical protein